MGVESGRPVNASTATTPASRSENTSYVPHTHTYLKGAPFLLDDLPFYPVKMRRIHLAGDASDRRRNSSREEAGVRYTFCLVFSKLIDPSEKFGETFSASKFVGKVE